MEFLCKSVSVHRPKREVNVRSGRDKTFRSGQVRSGQNRTGQNRTEQNRTEQNRTEQNRTEQNRTDSLLMEIITPLVTPGVVQKSGQMDRDGA